MADLEMYKDIPQGDMPGDKIEIGQNHVDKAELIYPILKEKIDTFIRKKQKAVVAVCGGSGVGKSEIASLIAFMLEKDGVKAYVMSGDNYPHRIPKENDAKRLAVYEEGGREALETYLGSGQEIDFGMVENIVKEFKEGKTTVRLKRMGREEGDLWFDEVDMSETQVLIIEWTHSNSDQFGGVDIPILLNSTPQETLAHRRSRNRDGAVDSPFTTMVLEIEQEMLKQQAHKAQIIVSKQGSLLSYEDYCRQMDIKEG